MILKFTKMHGAGNDFVVIDLISQRCKLRSRDFRKIADRRFGVGCDQILLVEPPGSPNVDFRYRIFNADGGEVEQCGNGARCFARFVRDKKLTAKKMISVETASGVITLRVRDQHQVEVDMGAPEWIPARIPFNTPAEQDSYQIEAAGQSLEIGAVSMGNPHAVTRVDEVDALDLDSLGPQVENHSDFPERVNAGFMQVISEREIRLRVFERGVGETLACGTGACAAVVYGLKRGWLRDSVTVQLPGGKLSISWPGDGHGVIMTGPTAVVFEGTIKV
ncbi:diaminopimelate epimerase [Halioglobus sp. HI00S01]|uniref:diaminopimelate epimerase n=1 Tax=Halioglobus sp. HI00S01 TaxID=1822214 RepID=UPI0007C2AD29|nr:diaminopimelate epimerase [Halioglobus sp. HI00S01]KZX56994.1 diaminopimelate epimerase [Halioglobus sp. HI00S01]